VVYTPNIIHIPVFVSLVMAHKAGPSTLNLLIGFLTKTASARPSAASPATGNKPLRRRPSVSELEIGPPISDDQGSLKALCALIAISQFDHIRYCRFLLLFELSRHLMHILRDLVCALAHDCTAV
jgi:hypothetical protein